MTDAGTTPATTSAEEPLVALLRRREWPERSELLARFVAYRQTHGAWDDSLGYSEGSLARVIEAALAVSPLLPSVKADSDFLCGMEFDSVRAELAFFRRVSRLPSPVSRLDDTDRHWVRRTSLLPTAVATEEQLPAQTN